MGSGELVAVVDADLARRVAVVEALNAAGHRAHGIANVARLMDTQRTPAIIVAHVADHAALVSLTGAVSAATFLVGTPLVVVAPFDSDVDAVVALGLGAVDFVDEDVDVDELCARVRARLRVAPRPTKARAGAEVVLELTQALSSTLELREILFTVVKRLAEAIAVDRASIVLLGDDDQDRAYVIAASDDESLRDLPIELNKYPEIRRVLDSGQPFVVDDTKNHKLFELAHVTLPSRFRSLVLFPIMFEDKPMGVLFLRFADRRALASDDEFVLRAIANATGIALRNASLLSNLRDQSRQVRNQKAQAEKRIEALRRYVAFFDSAPEGILVVTMRGRVLFCNPAACVIAGRSEQELREGSFADLLARDGVDRYQQLEESFKRGLFPNNVDLPIRTGDGRRRVLSVSFSSLLGSGESGIIIHVRDVTEDRALARELTKTKEFLQRVIDSSVDAIVSANMHGAILLFNPAAERVYGYDAAEVIGRKNVRDLYPKGVATEIMRHMRGDERGAAGVIHGHETELLGKDGRRIPVMLSAALIHHRGRAIGSVGVFRDLRSKLNIEERLADAQRELAEQEQKAFIAELAGATAHELNQPLTAVMGYASMLATYLGKVPSVDARLERAAGAIVRESERMAEIVRKIGKLTKFESKAYVGETRIIDIERSIDSEPPVTGR